MQAGPDPQESHNLEVFPGQWTKDTLPWARQKRLNRSTCHLIVGDKRLFVEQRAWSCRDLLQNMSVPLRTVVIWCSLCSYNWTVTFAISHNTPIESSFLIALGKQHVLFVRTTMIYRYYIRHLYLPEISNLRQRIVRFTQQSITFASTPL